MPLRYSLLIAVVVSAIAVGVGSCAKNPAQADGVVTITETTSTTTTSIIPDVTGTGITQTPPGIGLAGATLFTFAAQGLQGGKTPYTFAWEFGDGGAAGGEAPQHLYLLPGHFTVKVKVNDSSDKSVDLSAPLEVDTVSGRWTVTFAGAMASQSLDLVQSGTAVTGAINHTSSGPGAGSGSVSNPRSMQLSLTFASALPTPFVATFVGDIEPDLRTWKGTVTGYAACPCVFEATR